ncbi:uncharacterized protein LOC62_07G009304 [Vanrija pseudolonga]|uniref:Protein kinase domain-containing protein n=1 Tax=Vanrija pseudolonga TaxID=143232 RepID=A0AAF0YFP8_9TREE|nr:hypothetical protein LOC62_07G009304 [Vanrija pseudolonga]
MRTLISRIEEETWDGDEPGHLTIWLYKDEHGVVHRVERPGRDDIRLKDLPEAPFEYMPKWNGSWVRASDEIIASPNVWIKHETVFVGYCFVSLASLTHAQRHNSVAYKTFELDVLQDLYHAPGHPCVVKYHGAAVNADGFVYGLVFDKLNVTLQDAIEDGRLIRRNKPNPFAVMRDVRQGLMYLRSLGYLYTDLDASNVMWRIDPTEEHPHGNWCLVDFAECYKEDQRLDWDLGVGGGIPIGSQYVPASHIGRSLARLRHHIYCGVELPYDSSWPGQEDEEEREVFDATQVEAAATLPCRLHNGPPKVYTGSMPGRYWRKISFSHMVQLSAPASTSTRKGLGWMVLYTGNETWLTHLTFKDIHGTIHRFVLNGRHHQLDELPDNPLDPALYNECLAFWREPWAVMSEEEARLDNKLWLKEASKFLGAWSSRQSARELDNLHVLQANPHRNLCTYIGAVVNEYGFVRYLAFEKLQATLAEVVCDVRSREADPHYQARFESIPLDATTVLRDICDAINHIRSLGYVYTDLHACNVMWRPAADDGSTPGAWCLIDFEHCYPVNDIKGIHPQPGKTLLELADIRTFRDLNGLTDYIYTGEWFPKVDDLFNAALQVAEGGVPGQEISEE